MLIAVSDVFQCFFGFVEPCVSDKCLLSNFCIANEAGMNEAFTDILETLCRLAEVHGAEVRNTFWKVWEENKFL